MYFKLNETDVAESCISYYLTAPHIITTLTAVKNLAHYEDFLNFRFINLPLVTFGHIFL